MRVCLLGIADDAGTASSRRRRDDPLHDRSVVRLAPGFGLSFTGNFASVNGVMAASSLYFSANSSATVKGSLITYSPHATYVVGNISLDFDRANSVEIPAGFDLLRVLNYDASSYTLVF